VRYQLHNHLGSAALELDGTSAARVISYEEYHPFGTTAFQAKNSDIKSAAKRYRYTGMERDEETGLEYHSARYYMPWLGRWLNSDPIGIEGSMNFFAYVDNKPIVATDENGKEINVRIPGGSNVTEAERDQFVASLQDDIHALLQIETTYDPDTGIVQIADQTGDGIIDEADVQSVLDRIAVFQEGIDDPDRCAGDVRCAREAIALYRETLESILPQGFAETRSINLALTQQEPSGSATALGYAYIRQRDLAVDREANAALDPRDFDDDTEYVRTRDTPEARAYEANPNIDRIMGPLLLLLHEREHNVRGTRDPGISNGLNGANVPGPNERRVNSFRQALRLPTRRSYTARPVRRTIDGESVRRFRTMFDGGWVAHPIF
jgi:RHS repeat-associated protein